MGILWERTIILPTVRDLDKALMGGLRGKSVRISQFCNCWQNSKYQEEV